MTKAELIDRIARSRDLPPEVTKKVVAKVLDLAFAELSGYFVRARVTRTQNPRFTFPKFGTFTKKQRSGRRGVNPRTLEPIEIEACETVDFKPSVELKRQLNEASVAKPAKAKTKTKTKTKRGARAAQATQAASGSGSGSGSPASKPATRKKKKAARSSAKRRPAANSGTPAKVEVNKPHAAGPGGRKLVTREEAELELPSSEPLLPEAPLQRVARKRRADAQTGNTLAQPQIKTGTKG
jgi:nucleoid DNA-binding protein